MAQISSNKKVANKLVAMSAAAVLAVYAAGYTRTRSAADQLDAQTAERRPGAPGGRGVAPSSAGFLLSRQPEGRGEVLSAESGTSQPERGEADKTRLVASVEPLHNTGNLVTTAAGEASPAVSGAQVPAQPASSSAAPSSAERKSEASNTAPAVGGALAPAAAFPAPVSSPPVLASSVQPPPIPSASAVPAPASVASAAPVPATVPAAAAAPVWKDGTYTGWGTSRHGDIQSQVVIEGGRIVSAGIAQCLTRYSCSVISKLPPQVVQRQSAETDYVSGATQSTNAFYYGVVEALKLAK